MELIDYYEGKLASKERDIGSGHCDLADDLNNVALLYVAQGRSAEAEPLYGRALAIREDCLDSEHPAVAQILENYAVQQRAAGRSSEATEMEARAKAIRAKHAQDTKIK